MKILDIVKLTYATDNRFRWLNLFEALYEFNGKQLKWVFASRNTNLVLGNPLQTNAVIIVPIVNTSEGKRLLITKEFRLPIRTYEYGFPAGLLDPGENAEIAAARELTEETGLTVVKINSISPPIVSSAGLSDETVQMVFLEAEGQFSKDKLEVNENIDSFLLDYEEVVRLCDRTGEFENVMIAAKAWTILYMFKQLGHLC